MQQAANYLEEVRDQYENYPYPFRDPEEEKQRLSDSFYDFLDLINHYGFQGKKRFGEDFRVLIAGGGTGDATIFLAEQLREMGAAIVYLDISRASMAVAQQRAKVRGLNNIAWVHGSLLDAAKLGLGEFDYINSSGVLHHLENPLDGLKSLASVLKDDGVMGLMVYGEYGRAGLYHFQALMRLLTRDVADKQRKVDICKEALRALPPTHMLRARYEAIASEIRNFGDVGIYDLFLHSQDRAYTVPQLYDWVEEAGLHVQTMLHASVMGRRHYDPASYVKDEALRRSFSQLPLRERQAAAELLSGTITTHSFYATRRPVPLPSPKDGEMVPFLFGMYVADGGHEALTRSIAGQLRAGAPPAGSVAPRVTPQAYTAGLLNAIDGKRTVDEIIAAVMAEEGLKDTPYQRKILLKQFEQLFEELNGQDWFLLRHASVPAFLTSRELQARFLRGLGEA